VPELAREQERLLRADLSSVFPLWWGGLPAIKGWFDRVCAMASPMRMEFGADSSVDRPPSSG
jgi:putative NADPH-quinone reductase